MKHKTEEQLAFEQWYTETTFDLERSPLGSRDCYLQRRAWEAALAFQNKASADKPMITGGILSNLKSVWMNSQVR